MVCSRSVRLVLLVWLAGCDPVVGTPDRDGGTRADTAVRSDTGTAPDSDRPDVPARDTTPSCSPSATSDIDEDGFTGDIDCDDCSAQVNPGAFDEPGNGIDEDCDGADATVEAVECDRGLSMGGPAEDAARAIGLCRFTAEADRGWGVISARYVSASGGAAPNAMQYGILPNLGSIGPEQGGSVLAISSGVARAPGQPGFTPDCDFFGIDPDSFEDPPPGFEPYPPGFPVDSSSCPGVRGGPVYNSAALEVRIRVPTNALGFRFRSNFYTYEYPEFICDEFNDFFAVLRQEAGGTLENIVFDSVGEPVSVNNGLLQACTPGTHGGRRFDCSLGRSQLAGTGFDGTAVCGSEDEFGDRIPDVGAATGWLQTEVSADGGSILVLRFAVWDSGDPSLDSLALVDGFEWELDEVVSDVPMTTPLI